MSQTTQGGLERLKVSILLQRIAEGDGAAAWRIGYKGISVWDSQGTSPLGGSGAEPWEIGMGALPPYPHAAIKIAAAPASFFLKSRQAGVPPGGFRD